MESIWQSDKKGSCKKHCKHEGPENAGSEGASKRNKSVAKKPNVEICSYRKVEVGIGEEGTRFFGPR